MKNSMKNETEALDRLEAVLEYTFQDKSLPLTALTGGMDGSKWVWRCDKNGVLEKVPVTPGAFRGNRIHVSGALHIGDMIVVEGARWLTEKDTVKIFE